MEQKRRVLIVEDDVHLLSGIKEILELGNYAVTTAHNGIEGLQALANHKDLPDVIVSDIDMPHMDGFHFLEEVRKKENLVKIPFIFLTAYSERENKYKGAELGADMYLTKPFNAEDLLIEVYARIKRRISIDVVIDIEKDITIDNMQHKILNMLNKEFQTPITGDVYAQLFQKVDRNVMSVEDMMGLLQGVNTGANRLRRLVENFITMVELDNGDVQRTYEWRRQPVTKLRTLALDAYQQITSANPYQRVFECHVADDLPEFIADVTLLTMALRELLDNAARFTAADNHFVLQAQQVGEWIEIQVQDFGCGLPEGEFDKIWRPFYQFPHEQVQHQGAGSGLAIVSEILKIHGGTYSVMSDGRAGSTFTIRLPLHPPALPLRTGRVSGNMRQKYRVLIVEDDAHLLSGIKEILELEDYAVTTAHNGVEGLRVLNEQADPPDIIVSDVAMPYMDGFRFLEEVRKQDRWVKIPFIFLTAHGERTDRHKGAQLGADVYLTKPFNAEDLLVSVRTRIDRATKIKKAGDGEVKDMKRKILTILNHEFRTPLTLVVAYAELLKEFDPETMGEEDVMTFLKGVNSGANRLRRLVENFITLVELESGDAQNTYDMRRKPIVRLHDLMMDAFQQITYPNEEPRTFESHVAEDIPEFVGDAQMITVMMRELLDNAAKFTPVDSRFILRAECVGEWVEIQVQDFGRGIPVSEYDKVWQAFYQYERDKFEHQGAGSGLAIVDGILKIHGGERSVMSEEGQGSTFTIRLPLQPPSVTPRIEE